MKKCFKCGLEKPLSEYYVHKAMKDGHINKCKTCTKKDTAIRNNILISTDEGLESERQRHRDKYHRLGYKEKQKIWDKDKPWKKTSMYKSLHKKFNTQKGFELHHWNYNENYLQDVFVLEIKDQRKAHVKLNLCLDRLIFKDVNGNYLETKEQHLSFLLLNGINPQ